MPEIDLSIGELQVGVTTDPITGITVNPIIIPTEFGDMGMAGDKNIITGGEDGFCRFPIIIQYLIGSMNFKVRPAQPRDKFTERDSNVRMENLIGKLEKLVA